METATKTTRTLEIDGMSGDACVTKVTDALKGVHDVKTDAVKVGRATINADQAGCTAACTAVNAAGFKAREGASSGADGQKPSGSANGSQAAPQTTGQQANSQPHSQANPSGTLGANQPGAPTSVPGRSAEPKLGVAAGAPVANAAQNGGYGLADSSDAAPANAAPGEAPKAPATSGAGKPAGH